jgi:hypothetical protein
MRLKQLRTMVNQDSWLVHRGRFVDVRFLVEAGQSQHIVEILRGKIVHVLDGPFVMPRWTFALRAPDDAWSRFCQPRPEPGYHDLFAMIKHRTLRLEGDQQVFMANLLYFKDVLSKLRNGE